ncbi:MAG TPA: ABC transporter permease [Oceanobacillus sp.]|nr:ABC transporter permease [Oceanobacillus sp.]
MTTLEQSGITVPSTHSSQNRLMQTIVKPLSQVLRRPLPMLGFIIVFIFIIIAIFGPIVAPYRYDTIIRGAARLAPSAEHPFGTDRLARDVFSRVLWGARDIIGLPTITTALSVFFGTCIGLFIGYYGGWIDDVISRIMDGLLAIPALVLAMVMLGTIGSSELGIVIVIVLLYTPIVARVVRSATLGIRANGYIEAAKLRGERTLFILFREILPGVLPALVVEASLRFSYAIFLTASLGFLGLGVQPPSPDWGRMVNEARSSFAQAPWALWFPAGAIALLVIGVNLLSDGLRRIFRYEGQLG